MTIALTSYGSTGGVAAYVRHLTNTSGLFDDLTPTKPSLTQVEAFLDEQSDVLNGWLAAAGYVIPVTQANAKRILDKFANLGAAGLAELTQRSAGYSDTDENRRENKFLAAFAEAEAYIASGALAALGAAVASDPLLPIGLIVGGTTSSGQRLRPIFRRTSFGNVPDNESPPGKEPSYSSEV